MLLAGELTFGHARALAALAGRPEAQLAHARRAASANLSVRQIERLVAAGADPAAEAAAPRAPRRKAPYLLDLEERLTHAVGTRVRLLPGRSKNSGRIVVDYYSLDDFDRIAAALGLKGEEAGAA